MASIYLAIVFGIAWTALAKSLSVGAFLAGAVMGVIIARLSGLSEGESFSPARLVRRSLALARVLAAFVRELIVSNIAQLRIVLAPRLQVYPHWIRLETDLEHPLLRATLGMMISLTPGTITCESVDEDNRVFIIHAITRVPDVEIAAGIKRSLEEPLRRLERD